MPSKVTWDLEVWATLVSSYSNILKLFLHVHLLCSSLWRVRARKTLCCLHKNFDLELDSRSELQYVQTRRCPIVHSPVLQPASHWHFPFHAWNEEGLLMWSWLRIHVTEQTERSNLKIKSVAGNSYRACNILKPLLSGFKISLPCKIHYEVLQ